MRLNEVITRLIAERVLLEERYGYEHPKSNPLVVLASDEEGNSFYELNEAELEFDENWLILWPAGYNLDER